MSLVTQAWTVAASLSVHGLLVFLVNLYSLKIQNMTFIYKLGSEKSDDNVNNRIPIYIEKAFEAFQLYIN